MKKIENTLDSREVAKMVEKEHAKLLSGPVSRFSTK